MIDAKKAFCTLFLCYGNAYAQPMLFIDTGFHEKYHFNTVLSFAESLGFHPTFKSGYSLDPLTLSEFKTIILNIDPSYIAASVQTQPTQAPHPLINKINSILATLYKARNRTIVIQFGGAMGMSEHAQEQCLNLCNQFKIAQTGQLEVQLKTFLQALLTSDAHKANHYHTALLTKNRDEPLNVKIEQIIDQPNDRLLCTGLPCTENKGLAFWPIGLYIQNDETNNHFFISKSSLTGFDDIQENFIYNPIDKKLRTQMLNNVYAFMHAIHTTATKGTLSVKPKNPQLPVELLAHTQVKRPTLQQPYDWLNTGKIFCGWTELGPYKNKEYPAACNLLNSGLNSLWFEFRQELFFSDQASQPDKKETFLQDLDTYTKQLKQASADLNQPVPRIFAGTDITLNFDQTKVNNPVQDMFGTAYSKIPSPFDMDQLWQKEVIDVFDRFYKAWPQVSNGIPLAGIFFDFEMYHAQNQSGQYTDYMDFSDLAWNTYCASSPDANLSEHKTPLDRASYLIKHKKMENYFATLQKKAYEIGARIRNHIKKTDPNLMIGAYNIMLPYNWFYMGIIGGLSSPEEPLILSTFNNSFLKHQNWLRKNNIHVHHTQALLLSKFKNSADFELISDLCKDHDGIWFNKMCRLEESRDEKDWNGYFPGVEVTPLKTQSLLLEMKNQIEKHNGQSVAKNRGNISAA